MLSKNDLVNTKWDVRGWTQEKRLRWQRKMFDLGINWVGNPVKLPKHMDKSFYFINGYNNKIAWDNDKIVFDTSDCLEKYFNDLFPDPEEYHFGNFQEITEALKAGKEVYVENAQFSPFVLKNGVILDKDNDRRHVCVLLMDAINRIRKVSIRAPKIVPEIKEYRAKITPVQAMQFHSGMIVDDIKAFLGNATIDEVTRDGETDRVLSFTTIYGDTVTDKDFIVKLNNGVSVVYNPKSFAEKYGEV